MDEWKKEEEMERDLEKQIMNKWQEVFDDCSKGKWTHSLLPAVSVKHPVPSSWLSQGLSDHGGFAEYLFRFKRTDCPICKYGKAETTARPFSQTVETTRMVVPVCD